MSEPIELKIDARWKWAAKDENGKWWVYDATPKLTERMWDYPHGDAASIKAFTVVGWHGDWKDSLHQIIDGKLVKYVDVPGDGEKVIVGPSNYRRYSSGQLTDDGRLLCYTSGDKWSSGGERTGWNTWRRPTPEEAAQ